MQPRKGDWLQTFSGLAFWPLDPRPEEIRIDDIAHALSMQCRFTGHTKRFYSVAEHSVRVSEMCDPQDAMWGLLHDASEAYLSDVARPVKRLPVMAEYREAERQLLSVIVTKYGLSDVEPASVLVADKIILGIEARDLMSPLLPGWEKWLALIPADCRLKLERPWNPEQAEERFLARFEDLRRRKFSLADCRLTVSDAARALRSARTAIKKALNQVSKPSLFGEAQ